MDHNRPIGIGRVTRTDTIVGVLKANTKGCGLDSNYDKRMWYTNIRTHGILNNLIRPRVDDVIVHGKLLSFAYNLLILYRKVIFLFKI